MGSTVLRSDLPRERKCFTAVLAEKVAAAAKLGCFFNGPSPASFSFIFGLF